MSLSVAAVNQSIYADKMTKKISLYWPFLIQIVVGHHRNIDIVHLYTVYIKKNDPILLSLQYINERMQDVGM